MLFPVSTWPTRQLCRQWENQQILNIFIRVILPIIRIYSSVDNKINHILKFMICLYLVMLCSNALPHNIFLNFIHIFWSIFYLFHSWKDLTHGRTDGRRNAAVFIILDEKKLVAIINCYCSARYSAISSPAASSSSSNCCPSRLSSPGGNASQILEV